MDHLAAKIKGPLKVFMDRFGEQLRKDDYQQFFSNRRQAGRDTYLSSDFYRAEKLSSVILEEYGVRGKLQGNVMLIYPDPGWNVPFFMFQLGGNDSKSIALLDIAPTLPDTDYSPLIPVWAKYRDALGMGPSKIDWVSRICSPYLLHAQYEVLDTELFLEAMEAYLDIWIEHYYLPATRLEDATQIEIVTNALYKYKHVLHANDPAYGVFERAWGRPVADAFHYVETCEHPALPMPEEADPYAPVWDNPALNILWTLATQRQLEQEPEAVRQDLREAIERQAHAWHFGMITPEVYQKCRSSLGPADRALAG